jgi:hypothetical protein
MDVDENGLIQGNTKFRLRLTMGSTESIGNGKMKIMKEN